MSIFALVNFTLKKQSENLNTDHLNHLYGTILCDSYYVFRGLARGVSVVNFALSEATSKSSKPTVGLTATRAQRGKVM